MKLGPNPFCSRDRVQTSFCWIKIWHSKFEFKVPMWPWKWGQCHQNLHTSLPFPVGVSVQLWSQSIYWFRRECRQGSLFTVFVVWWSWNLGQGHRNLIKSFNYTNDTIHNVWLFGQNPSSGSGDRSADKAHFSQAV